MTEPLRILVVEDDPDDADLLQLTLERGGFRPALHRVDTAEEFIDALERQEWDIIISDYSLPGFSGLHALRLMQERNLDLPFIIISGAIGEDTAVAVMKAGAHDYVMKDKLARLVPAIERELRETQVRRGRRVAERLLRESQRRYEELINSIDGIVWDAEPDSFRLSFISEKAASLLGFPTVQWLAEPNFWINGIHPLDRDWVLDYHRIAMQSHTSYQVEYRRLRADGSSIWVRDMVRVVHDANGNTALRGIMVDIDEQKQREHEMAAIASISAALRNATTRAETLEIALQLILTIVPVDAVCFCRHEPNRACQVELMLGDWEQDFETAVFIDAADKILQSSHPSVWSRSPSGAHIIAIPLFAQGQPLGVLWTRRVAPVPSGASKIGATGETAANVNPLSRLLTSLADIVAGAIHRATLYEQTQVLAHQLQQIMDTAPQGFLLLDDNYRILLANPSAQAGLAILARSQVGDRLVRLGEHPIESILAESNGQADLEIVVNDPIEQIFEVAIRPVAIEFDHKGWLIVFHDVTEIRHAQQHAQQQSRLAAIGQLAAGIAHDFNNILGVITLYTGLIQRTPTHTPKDRERLELISQQIEHATNLIHQILDFSRRSIMERAPLDLTAFLHQLVSLLDHTMPDTIRLHYEPPATEVVIEADPTRLQQALINLVVNARDAMPNGGHLFFRLDTITLLADNHASLTDLGPGRWARLQVVDTGSGIDPEVLPYLFTPFFTTKGPGKGTGLGLAQVYGIIKQHGGHITVESQPKNGTTFTLYFPIISQSPSPQLEVQQAPESVLTGETILIVEDNDASRGALREALEALGYRVHSAANGQEALTLLDSQSLAIDLVVSDLMMPTIGGDELLQKLAARYPSTPVILVTGYPLDNGGKNLLEQGIVDWVLKPFTIEDIVARIRKGLEAHSSP